MKASTMFEFLFRKATPTPTPVPVTPQPLVSVDDIIKGILDDGSTTNLLVVCISEQDPFAIGGVAYASMRTKAIIDQTIFTLEDGMGSLFHITGEQFLQWTRPAENGVWA